MFDFVIEAIEVSALLLSLLIILLGLAPLGIWNCRRLRLSLFSSIKCLNELGHSFFSHRQNTLDS
jgi:hypothetical protein